MRGQADLFLNGDAPQHPIEAKPVDKIILPNKDPLGRAETSELEEAARMLEASGDYRVLRRLPRRPIVSRDKLAKSEHVAIIVDTETTGLDHSKDEIIELGMVAYTYDEAGRMGDVIGTFSALREPSIPISPEIARLTGITPEMVSGHELDLEAVERFLEPADLVIAHNARFDRPFCERLSKGFQIKAWACSHSEVPWGMFGFEGTKLGYLLAQSGWFHDGHRAVEDCYALLEVLARPPSTGTAPPFSHLLVSARKSLLRIWAEGSPFHVKDVLKARGYRWNDGSDGRPKSWWVEIDEEVGDAELTFLRREIYQREVEPYMQKITAYDRFRSVR